MPKKSRGQQNTGQEADRLRNRLEETEETLRAIQEHMVDAFVVNRENGAEVVTLHESEVPYRLMVESMNEGAVTLIPDGTIFYCNSRFGEMIGIDCDKLIGRAFQELLPPEERAAFQSVLERAGHSGVREEFTLQAVASIAIPVQLSVYQLGGSQKGGIAVIATDISERIQSEEKIRALASKLTLAEQEERHRISQVLHDDLQQRLFAIKAQLGFLNDIPGKDKIPASAFSELDQIQASLSEAIAITRNLSIDLNPVVLHGEGLAEAVSWLSFRMKEQYGLHVDIDAHDQLASLNQAMRMMLFQSIRELLFNVVKHAGVLEASIKLEMEGGRGRITVTDHGAGFDSEMALSNANKSHGLLVVQDRLNLLGCTMKVISHPGDGTSVVIEFAMEGNLG